ncbi:MAG: hypothetical protein QNJ40_20260 [Xanthomonadales bacterium]|nr:hypothetical protein [Xanthomonadales bacterium]
MRYFAIAATLVLTLGSSPAGSQSSGGSYDLTQSTIDNGGGTSTGGSFTLTGTIGQPDASLQTAAGGQFQLTGGFWANGEILPVDEVIFFDSFEGL